jgi:hypothetical protein
VARIESLVKSLVPAEEVDPPRLQPDVRHLYDWQAWERLQRGEADARVDLVLFPDLDDGAARRAHERQLPVFTRLVESLRPLLEVCRVAARYAYRTLLRASANRFSIEYASSFGYMEAFERVKAHYEDLLASLNDALWGTLKYVEYAVLEAEAEEVRAKVLSYYNRIPQKYIDVVVFEDEVHIYVAKQLKGRVIGRQGATVRKLEELVGRRVRVYEDTSLTRLYEEEHPELPEDPKVYELVAQLVPILEMLESRGVTLRQVERAIEEMRKPEPEEVVEDGEG